MHSLLGEYYVLYNILYILDSSMYFWCRYHLFIFVITYCSIVEKHYSYSIFLSMGVWVDFCYYLLCYEQHVCVSLNTCASLPWTTYIISHLHHNPSMWLVSHFTEKEAKTHKAHEACLGSQGT